MFHDGECTATGLVFVDMTVVMVPLRAIDAAFVPCGPPMTGEYDADTGGLRDLSAETETLLAETVLPSYEAARNRGQIDVLQPAARWDLSGATGFTLALALGVRWSGVVLHAALVWEPVFRHVCVTERRVSGPIP